MKRLSPLWDAARTPTLWFCLALFVAATLSVVAACGSDTEDEGRSSRRTVATRTATPEAASSAVPLSTTAEPTATPVPTVEVTPAPEPPPPPPPPLADDFVALQASMQAAVEEYWIPGDYAVAITDLQTGETASVNGDRAQLSGCVANLFVLFQVARDLEAGKYAAEYVEWLVSTTTWQSDAHAAYQLYGVVGDGDVLAGVRHVNTLIHDLMRLDEVVLDHPPGYDDSVALDPNNWVTAEVVNRALAAFWQGEVVGVEGRAYLLDHLATVKPGLNYLTAAVPEGTVSHKNGFLQADTGFVDNDAGIIRLTRGDAEYAYAMTFLSQEVPSKYADVVLGQQLASLAYQTMAARYP